ncbi:MAG: OB-fold nucleic acid binding domain-containing protein [Promethearchaeota archaeon]
MPINSLSQIKNIGDLSFTDVRVWLVGRIIDFNDGFIEIEDDTGKIRVNLEYEHNDKIKKCVMKGFNEGLKKGLNVRIIAEIIPTVTKNFNVHARIIQNLDKIGFDPKKYQKFKNLEKKFMDDD